MAHIIEPIENDPDREAIEALVKVIDVAVNQAVDNGLSHEKMVEVLEAFVERTRSERDFINSVTLTST